jgi:hypothetical protein
VLKYTGDAAKDAEAKANLKAAQDLIGEAIRLAKPRKDELIYCVIGAPAQASVQNREAIIEAAREHVDSVMLCSEPFSVAYGLDMARRRAGDRHRRRHDRPLPHARHDAGGGRPDHVRHRRRRGRRRARASASPRRARVRSSPSTW